ncbi:Hypp429 [Branchiostoma lanceolatum]|uniref:Hypp429 protein n=1 Tax=Branchiostoma lanceolatum TaxID=7740 RepID=A0A8J9WD95_BRALA|nr:Hypp429 [Branchiostoma lanceolatum]
MSDSSEDTREETPEEEPVFTRLSDNTSEEQSEDPLSGSPLSFKDFLPRLIGEHVSSEYERFGTLVDRANAFLEDHRQYDVRTCETLEVQYSGDRQVACTDVSLVSGRRSKDPYIRGLRLWLVPAGAQSPTSGAPRIGKVDFVPRRLPEDQAQSDLNQFESLGELLGGMNESFRQDPIPGEVLTVETLDMECSTDGTDPDSCSWHENEAGCTCCCSCLHRTIHLYVIRVFYLEGPPVGEEITMVDFVPRVVHPATSFIDDPILETFPKLTSQARGWVRHHLDRGGRVTNLQTVSVKATRHGMADSQRSFYIEGSGSVLFVRTLRLVYVKRAPSRDVGEVQPCARTFAPLQLNEDGYRTKPQFQTVLKTMEEAVQWLRIADCRVISAETLTVKIPPNIPRGWAHLVGNESLWCRNKSLGELYLVMLRIYFEGPPKDTASARLPILPQSDMGQSKCTLL